MYAPFITRTWGYLTLLAGLLFLSQSCVPKTDIGELSADKTEFSAASSGDTLKVIITSNEAWTAKSAQTWLSPNITRGTAGGSVRMTINVEPNFGSAEREGTVEIASATKTVSLLVKQHYGDVDISNQTYDLKVIFHVLYNAEEEKRLTDQNSPTDQYDDYYPINSTQLQEILNKVNDIYKGWPEEPPATWRDPRYYAEGERPFRNLNLKFSLATEDPDGNQLTPAGIIRHEIPEKELTIEEVMGDKSGGKYHDMAFPLYQYINVFIFPFKTEGDGTTMTLGVAHLPHGTKNHPIPGLGTLDNRVARISNYNHCVAINSKIFEPRRQEFFAQGKDTPYKTIAHELGHIVGLMHVFAEEVTETATVTANSCIDSDYCEDTPSYNRVSYESDFAALINTQGGVINLGDQTLMSTLRSRYDCDRQSAFLSSNVMDYDWTYGDRFSTNQKERAREALYYSFTIPGFKVEEPSTATRSEAYATPLRTECRTKLIK